MISLERPAFKALVEMGNYIRGTSLPPLLKELFKIRASNLNGWAPCLNMHKKEALERRQDVRRLLALTIWQEPPLFTEEALCYN